MKTIADHILDIVQNSIRANATLIEIIVEENKINDICIVSINDNGCGMSKEILQQATNPFFTSRNTRKVGMGLSLLKQNAERTGGNFEIHSEEKIGTKLKAGFRLSHLDKPPLGEIWDVYYLTLLGNENITLVYQHKTETGFFEINSREIKEMLVGVPINQKEIKNAIIEIIKNNLTDIKATL